MALLWDRVQRLNPECHQQLLQFYEYPERWFLMEARCLFAKEIEEAVCGTYDVNEGSGLDPNNPDHYIQITRFLSDLVEGLKNRISQESSWFTQQKLSHAVAEFDSRMDADPLGLYRTIKDCIFFENNLVDLHSQANLPRNGIPIVEENVDIVQNIRSRITSMGGLLTRLGAEQESFELNRNQKQTYEAHVQRVRYVTNPDQQTQDFQRALGEQINIMGSKVQENLRNIASLSKTFEESAELNLSALSNRLNLIISKIQVWKYEQQLLANGSINPDSVPLTELQLWCEELADLMWTTRQQLKEAERQQTQIGMCASALPEHIQTTTSRVPRLLNHAVRLLSELLCGSFLVEHQPPQVIKLRQIVSKNQPVTVSLLAGTRLNVEMTSPVVTTCIINENYASRMTNWDAIREGKSGVICNGSSKLELNPDDMRLSTRFRSMQVKEIVRGANQEKKPNGHTEKVMEEKFCLLFESVLMVGDLSIKIWTRSMPVVVITNVSQEAQALTTTCWDNAFGKMGRVPFQVPQQVKWTELADSLARIFKLTLGEALNEGHLYYLERKVLGENPSKCITWNQLFKDLLPGRNFSFSNWLFSALLMMGREDTNLAKLWEEGLIFGFVEREMAANLLQGCAAGTFLLRFSDSLLAAITIAWVHEDGNILLVKPFQLDDLKKERLANIILELDFLKFLYPNHSKQDVFGPHYSTPGPFLMKYVTLRRTLGPTITGVPIESGTPSATPHRTRSNSSTVAGPSDEAKVPSAGAQLYGWPSSSVACPSNLQSLNTSIRMGSEMYSEETSENFNNAIQIPKQDGADPPDNSGAFGGSFPENTAEVNSPSWTDTLSPMWTSDEPMEPTLTQRVYDFDDLLDMFETITPFSSESSTYQNL